MTDFTNEIEKISSKQDFVLFEVFITKGRKLHTSNEILSLKSEFFADLEEEPLLQTRRYGS